MTITIRDKHTGEEKDYWDFFELYTDPIDINIVISSKEGWKKPYSFNKKDYEVVYIG